jgi:predicted secreted protein
MRTIFAGLAVVACAAPALADPPAAAGGPTVLHLSQSADRKLTRDVLHVELRAEKTGADPQTVEAAINQSMAKALAQAKQTPGIDVETGPYSVDRETPPNAPPRWGGSQTLFLSGADADALLKLAGMLQTQGLVMSNLGYQASPKTVRSTEDELAAEALSGLERRAAAIAQQLHLSVLGYRDLTVGNAQVDGGVMPRMAFSQPTGVASLPAPVAAPGNATVRVTVTADILLSAKPP